MILTPQRRSLQVGGSLALKGKYAAVASIVRAGMPVNAAPGAAALVNNSLTQAAVLPGLGWASNGTTGQRHEAGRVAYATRGLTLVAQVISSNTSTLSYLCGTVNTGLSYLEFLAFNSNTAGALTSNTIYATVRATSGGSSQTAAQFTCAPAVNDGKLHTIVAQWSLEGATAKLRAWVDGVEQSVSYTTQNAFAQSAGIVDFTYAINSINSRGSYTTASIDGSMPLFARLLTDRVDGAALSKNPWREMFRASQLQRYMAAFGASGVYAATLTESASTTDAAAAALIANAAISEAMAAADATLAAMIAAVSASESVNATDTVAGANVTPVSLSESVTATDAQTVDMTTASAIAEAVTVTDVPAATMTAAATVSEAASLTDALNGSVGLLTGSVAESVALADAPSVTFTAAVALAEAVSLIDALISSADRIYTGAVVEAASASDAWSAVLSGGVFVNPKARSAGRITQTASRPAATAGRRRT